jgi:hypothetical protein
MAKSKRKRKSKTVLKLPDLEQPPQGLFAEHAETEAVCQCPA